MEASDCYQLRRLLEASPVLHQLRLRQLHTPESAEEVADLACIIEHPLWRSNDGGGPHCTPVTEMHQDSYPWLNPDELAFGHVLSALPTMPTVTNFSFSFKPKLVVIYERRARQLHHIHRAFPNLSVLWLAHLTQQDSDLTELYACKHLCQLDI